MHDLDPAVVGPEALGHLAEDRHPLAELDHERLEVEDDVAARGAHNLRVVFEDVDQLPVRSGDRVDPELLDARALEHPIRGPPCELPQSCRHGRGQALLLGREPIRQLGLHVHPLVQLVHQRRRDLLADLLVGDERAGGGLHRVRVEALEAHVPRQEAQNDQ